MEKKNKVLSVLTVIKYLSAVIITGLTFKTTNSLNYVIAGLLELYIIGFISNLIVKKHPKLGNVFNFIFILFYLIQVMVLFFGNSYVELVMLSNLDSLEDLGGKAVSYSIGVGAVVITSFLPITYTNPDIRKYTKYIAPVLICISEFVVVSNMGIVFSPIGSYKTLVIDYIEMNQLKNITNVDEDYVNEDSVFFSTEITDYYAKDSNLPENPNVILIFAEGLSQNIIEDSRNIMPNIASFEKESIYFDNYYNHTFATYRGLIGQLFSGYQLENLDANNLISIQSIFQDKGYYTGFFNVEPNNETFSDYLASFNFDDLFTTEADGLARATSDKLAYEHFLEKALEYNIQEEPFFLSMYTVGTHASLYSPHEVYGDGSDNFLNKFYNLDYQFGAFLEAFNNSELAENTIIVFTADHSTFTDNDFTTAFPGYMRDHSMCDEIPLCIYYKGMEAQTIDVSGRNSLCLSPTILDFLDISENNYFLGSSLFSEEANSKLETTFSEEADIISTTNGEIAQYSSSERTEIRNALITYYREKSYDFSGEDDTSLELVVSEDGSTMEIIFYPETTLIYTGISFPVWSLENGQDDLIWYTGVQQEDGTVRATVPLEHHGTAGTLYVQAYVDSTSTMLVSKTIVLGL